MNCIWYIAVKQRSPLLCGGHDQLKRFSAMVIAFDNVRNPAWPAVGMVDFLFGLAGYGALHCLKCCLMRSITHPGQLSSSFSLLTLSLSIYIYMILYIPDLVPIRKDIAIAVISIVVIIYNHTVYSHMFLILFINYSRYTLNDIIKQTTIGKKEWSS